MGIASQIALSALSGSECVYVTSEITDGYSRKWCINKYANYIPYKVILDMQTLST